MSTQRFTTVVRAGTRGAVVIPVPFDPNVTWREKSTHHVGGTVNGRKFRGAVRPIDSGWAITIGPMWQRDAGISAGNEVAVVLSPEGPQRDDLYADIAAALDDNPAAGAFFDSLAQFYRKAYLTWIAGTKGRPEVRAQRISETMALLEAGHKSRPRPTP